jgi:hypothetical protein
MSVYKWQVHRCPGASGHFTAQPHFHLLINPRTPSWPFWSLETGLKMVDFCITNMITPDDPELPLEKVQAAKTSEELFKLSKSQRRAPNGVFLKGFVLPQRSQYDSGEVAESWAAFFRGEAPCVYVHEKLLMRRIPLVGCDFIHRPDDARLPHRGIFALERAPAYPRKVADAGITLELVI